MNEYNETLSDNLLMSNFEQSGNFTLSQDNQLEKTLSIESKAYERAAEAWYMRINLIKIISLLCKRILELTHQ